MSGVTIPAHSEAALKRLRDLHRLLTEDEAVGLLEIAYRYGHADGMTDGARIALSGFTGVAA